MTWINEVDFVVDRPKMLQIGDSSEEVYKVQERLRSLGYLNVVDGIFGPATERAVEAFQRDSGLVVDGLVGEKTKALLRDARPNSRYLSQEDLEWAADVLGVPVAAVMAVNEIESRGSGFFSSGRPAILYERHIMRRRLLHYRIDPNPHISQQPNIVNSKTGGYFGGEREHDRLEQAKRIHTAAGLESASWGLFQIMGFHWEHLEYSSAEHYVRLMESSERNHLDAFVRFNQKDRNLHNALRRRDWTEYARRYNGPGYAKNSYHTKLARAFERYARVFGS